MNERRLEPPGLDPTGVLLLSVTGAALPLHLGTASPLAASRLAG
jgi:hypothetical protein